jgi:HEAT repeat protein
MLDLGLDTFEDLVDLCRDRRRDIPARVRACFLLGQLRCPEALNPLLAVAVEEEQPELVWETLSAIGAIGSLRATRPLLRLLRSTRVGVKRRGAVFALMQLADERARQTLARIVGDRREEEKTRGLAAEALGFLRSVRRSNDALIAVLRDPSAEVRLSALCALDALHDTSATGSILPLLGDSALADGGESIAERAALVLLSLGDTSGSAS